MAKINFNYEFTELDGKTVKEQPDEFEMKEGVKVLKKKYPPFTLKTASMNALSGINLSQGDCPRCGSSLMLPDQLTGEEKLGRWELAMKIYKSSGTLDLGIDDIKLLKELIVKTHPSNLICGQAWKILDPDGTVGEK